MDTLLTSVSSRGVATLTFNRPDRANSYDAAMLDALADSCESFGRDAAVRAALQLHGAIGYTDEHDIGVTYKRAVALAAKYGNEITHVGRFSGLTLAPRAAE